MVRSRRARKRASSCKRSSPCNPRPSQRRGSSGIRPANVRRHNRAFSARVNGSSCRLPACASIQARAQNEPIRRGAGKPHLVAEVFRTGGERIIICKRHPNGLSETGYRKMLATHRSQALELATSASATRGCMRGVPCVTATTPPSPCTTGTKSDEHREHHPPNGEPRVHRLSTSRPGREHHIPVSPASIPFRYHQ